MVGTKSVNSFLWGLAIGVIFSNGLILINKREEQRKQEIENLTIPKSSNTLNTRGYNFHTSEPGNYYNYTDEEIRMMREKVFWETNGEYYIKTPGRYVPTHEQMIEDYIIDNFEDLIEKYQD